MLEANYNVLFLCTANSARSILAEAILNQMGGGLFKAFSAGSHPRGSVNPYALNLLHLAGHDVSQVRSKSWDEFVGPDATRMAYVFTVCDAAANETCPIWPGQPMTAHWGVSDPARVDGNQAEIAVAFDEAYRMLRRRIELFLALPLASIGRVALQGKLRDIGALSDAGASIAAH
jgi:arsenate reductase